MITITLLFRLGHQKDIKQCQRRDKDEGEDEKHQERQEGENHAFQGQRHLTELAFLFGQPAEDERWQVTSHEHHHRHADDGHLGQGAHGRMLGKDQGTDADKHEDAAEDDTVAVVFQHPLAVGVFMQQSFGDIDGVVVALTEDECRQDDVDDVELDVA